MRHFAINMWRHQKKKEVIGRFELLCSVRAEKDFEEKFADLEKDLNESAKEWLTGETGGGAIYSLVSAHSPT